MTEKAQLVARLRGFTGELARATAALHMVQTIYTDRGYDAAGADPIVDADLTELNVTAAQVNSMMTLADTLYQYMEQAARRQLVSRFRSDL